MKENVIIVPSTFDSEKVLIQQQKTWSAVTISERKLREIEYLAVYRTQDSKYEKRFQWTLFWLYKVIDYKKVETLGHENSDKYILYLGEMGEKLAKKSPRIYQSRDYMKYDDFIALTNA